MENSILQNLRQEYEATPLDEDSILKNPVEQFRIWFEDAVRSKLPEPNAMALATANVDFKPSVRMVLLKGIEDNAFIFFTNYNSRKGKELLWNPYATLLFFWNELHRQVRIEGRVKKIPAEESDRYFQLRPEGSQLSAMISPQSEVIAGRKFLEEKLSDAEKEFSGKQIPRPEHWGGYKVIPQTIEFWQGRASRLHDRILFTLVNENEWKIERLAP
ncbi:MAG TPA: pyridoxamine 5'-phosphate oxidase [Chitinophagales bacterium]|nr:pyridoxamine 5'-phosphate oxidase [Chitinophagales bacterium]